MSEPNVFYYETEIEWTKEKEGRKGPLFQPVSVGPPPGSRDEGNGRNISLLPRSTPVC
jgi:hypothetical protein